MTQPERVLVVGNGGRECALANAVLVSPDVERLLITPPNWGVLDPQGGARVTALSVAVSDHAGLLAAAQEHNVDLAVIGPEAPLCDGLADKLRQAGVRVLGAGKAGARLEGSKAFAKDFMQRHGIPTGQSKVFDDADALLGHVSTIDGPCVLKADGLAAGKGVILCSNREEALAAAKRMVVDRAFGAAADRVVVEERLFGREISFTCLVANPQEASLVAASTDYKPLLDGDQGPNTGGMGNICPTPFATDEVLREFQEQIFTPFLAGLQADGLDYRGFLFIGTMLTADGLKVLEFNARLGDPEAQVVLPLVSLDWASAMAEVAEGRLPPVTYHQQYGACVAVVLASKNYPFGKSEPALIEGLERVHKQGLLTGDPPPVCLHFAGVSKEASAAADPGSGEGYINYYDKLQAVRFLATGGRVLAVSALGSDLSDARRLAYEVVGNLHFEGMQYRTDIGQIR
jgi:phosphoribosylamine--glycine ligase